MIEFHVFACSCLALSTLFFEEAIFAPLYASVPFVKYSLTIESCVYFWALYSVPLIYVSGLMPVPGCFDYNGLLIQFDIRYCIPPTLFFLKIAVAFHGHLWFHINFWNVSSISVKYVIGTLIGITLNLYIALRSMDILMM